MEIKMEYSTYKEIFQRPELEALGVRSLRQREIFCWPNSTNLAVGPKMRINYNFGYSPQPDKKELWRSYINHIAQKYFSVLWTGLDRDEVQKIVVCLVLDCASQLYWRKIHYKSAGHIFKQILNILKLNSRRVQLIAKMWKLGWKDSLQLETLIVSLIEKRYAQIFISY